MALPEKFAVVLLPDLATSRRAVEASRLLQLVAVEPKLVLGPEAIPHVSLFHLMLDPDRIDQLEEALSDGLIESAGFNRRDEARLMGDFNPHLNEASGGYVFWNAVQTPVLTALAQLVLDTAAPLRAGDIEISWPMNDDQKEMHRRYGYPSVGTSFRPHITVSVGKPGVFQDGALPWGDQSWTWNSDRLAIGRLGPKYGTLATIERIIRLR